jgi:pimeloyl-ACP methyl ester carboxylesterase
MDQETFSKRFDSFKARLSANQPSIADLDAQPGRFEMPVVVLVHGIGGNASHWSNPAADVTSTWLFNTKAKPAGSGQLVDISPAYKPAEVRSWCKVLSSEGISYVNYSQPPGKLLEETASELAQLLRAVEATIYDPPAPNDRQPPLIMLCHSRGGLVTRLALNTLDKQALPHLTRVITLCTPHEGSYIPLLAKNVSEGQVDFSKLSDTLLGRVLTIGLNEENAETALSDLGQVVKKYLSGAFGAAGMGTDFDELIPTNALFTDSLSADEPLPDVSYHGFSGLNPAIVVAYVNAGPLHHPLLTISSPQIMTYLREILPGFSSTYKGLAELDTGDSSVAPASSHWPDRFKANHYSFPVNHMEALIDQNLQNAVIDLIEGKDFTKLVEEAAAKGKASSDWLNDPTVSAIHDAFLLGWTTIELKSRVQLATRDQLILSECSALNGDRSALAHDDSTILGWLLAEVQRMSGLSTPDMPEPDFNSNLVIPAFGKTDSVQLTSLSRSLFSRIAALHFKHFPINNTANTTYAYNPKDSGKAWSFLNNVPQEITNFGIRSLGPVKDDNGMERTPLADFGLYELTRQAINCLALLFTVSSESLIGTTIAEYQRRLVLASDDGPHTDPLSADEWNCAIQKLGELIVNLLEAWDGYLREQYFIGGEFKDDEIELVAYEAGRSMATISWCTSVRVEPLERLLQGLQDKEETRQKQALCYLTYLEQRKTNPDVKLQDFKSQDVNADETTIQKRKEQLEQEIKKAWKHIFDRRDIIRLQHQITMLSTNMDEAFYRLNRGIKKPANDVLVPPNPELPSQAIHAIRHSLDYWERTISLLCAKSDKEQPKETPPTGQSTGTPLPKGTLVLSEHWPSELRSSVIKQSNAWQSLMTGEQNVRSFSADSATQKIVSDLMDDFEEAFGKELGRNWPWLIAIGLGLIALIVVVVLLFISFNRASNQGNANNALPNTVLGGIATLVALLGVPTLLRFNGSGSAHATPETQPVGILGITGAALVNAFEKGYEQVSIEFSYLNYNLAVAYPLVEFFILNEIKIATGESQQANEKSNQKKRRLGLGPATRPRQETKKTRHSHEKRDERGNILIQNGYQFLVNVIWTHQDRDEEIKHIARAAFGPVGAFIGGKQDKKNAKD